MGPPGTEIENEPEIIKPEKSVKISIKGKDEKNKSKVVILQLTQLPEEQTKLIQETNEVLELSEDSVRIILALHGFNKETTLEKYYNIGTEDPTEKLIKFGIPPVALAELEALTVTSCMICDSEIQLENSITTGCLHVLCVKCFRDYLTEEIMERHNSNLIFCAVTKCNLYIGETLILKSQLDTAVMRKYQDLKIEEFVLKSRDRNWCPKEGCNLSCHVTDLHIESTWREIVCNCGLKYCFQCLQISHFPLKCDITAKLVQKFGQEIQKDQIQNGDESIAKFCSVKENSDFAQTLMRFNELDEEYFLEGKLSKLMKIRISSIASFEGKELYKKSIVNLQSFQYRLKYSFPFVCLLKPSTENENEIETFVEWMNYLDFITQKLDTLLVDAEGICLNQAELEQLNLNGMYAVRKLTEIAEKGYDGDGNGGRCIWEFYEL